MGELIQQIRQIWNNMDQKKRLLVGGGMLLFLMAFFFFVFQMTKPQYELLYGNLTQIEQDEIIGKLREMNVPYKKDFGAVYVPHASEVRAELMKEGIPKGGIVGWEIFDRSSLGTTNFQNAVNYQRALQDELRRTLREIHGIMDAQVILDIPDEEPVFSDEKKDPTAAITLKLRAPNALSTSQVQAIVNLVANSVVGMKPENVTIIDNFANDLTAALRRKKSLNGTSLEENLSARIAFENELERGIETMLGRVFGPGRVVVRVNAELNFDYQEIKREIFGDEGVPRSEQEINEVYEGSGSVPYGVPGTDSNLTEYRLLDENQRSSYEKNERTVNYEINRTEERLIKAPGTVERLTVSLFIDEQLSPDQITQIEDSVAAAVGLQPERGDQISVVSLRFNQQEPEELPTETLPWQVFLRWGIPLLILVLGSLLVLRMVRNRRTTSVDLLVGEGEEEQAAGEEVSPEEKKRRQRQEFLENLANDSPEMVAALLRTWLAED